MEKLHLTANERINFLIKEEGISEYRLSQLSNVAPQTIYTACAGGKVSRQTLEKILTAFPNYSKQWLINGIGDFKNTEELIPAKEVISDYRKELERKDSVIQTLTEQVDRLSRMLSKAMGVELGKPNALKLLASAEPQIYPLVLGVGAA